MVETGRQASSPSLLLGIRALVRASIVPLLLLVCALSVAAQTNGGSNGNGQGQPSALDGLVRDLRDAPDLGVATIRARKVREQKGGDAALLKLVRDRGLGTHVLRGILTLFEEENHRGPEFLKVFFGELASKQPPERLEIFRHMLGLLDSKGSLLKGLLDQARNAGASGPGEGLLAAITVLTDTPPERLEVIDVLLRRLQEEKNAQAATRIEAALSSISLQSLISGPAAWRAWFERFRKAHPAGFTTWDLNKEAVRLAVDRERRVSVEQDLRRRLIEESRRSIDDLAGHGDIPDRFFAPGQHAVAVRLHAASKVADAWARAAEQRKGGLVRRLFQSIESDPDVKVKHAVLGALKFIAGAQGAKADPVRELLVTRTRDLLVPGRDARLLLDLVQVCAALRDARLVESLEAIYTAFLEDEGAEAVALRAETIEALARAKKPDGGLVSDRIILAALDDKAPSVRRAVLRRALGAEKNPRHAEAVAELLKTLEADAEGRVDYVIALRNIAVYSPEVIGVLLVAGAETGEVQLQALLTLLAARASSAAGIAPQVEELLMSSFPARIAKEEDRDKLVAELVSLSSDKLVTVAARWCGATSSETQRKQLVRSLKETARQNPGVLVAAASELVPKKHLEDAELLLREAERQLAASNAGPARTNLQRTTRLLLGRVLRLRGRKSDLEAAEKVLTQGVEGNQKDTEMLWERARVRVLLRSLEGAAADLSAVLQQTAPTDPGGIRLPALAAFLRVQLDRNKLDEAWDLLEPMPRAPFTGEVHLLAGQVAFRLGKWSEAYREARDAQSKGAGDSQQAVLMLLLRSGLKTSDGTARLQAASVLEKVKGTLPAKEADALGTVVTSDSGLQQLVAELDSAGPDSAVALDARAVAKGPIIGVWLVHGLKELPQKLGDEAEPIIRRRLGALQRIFKGEAPSGLLTLPKGPQKSDDLARKTRTVHAWWHSRKEP